MQYLSADITTFNRQCQTPNKLKSYFGTQSSTLQQELNDFNKNKGFQSEQCPKANQNTPDGNRKQLITYNNFSQKNQRSEQNQQEWPQIKQIVNKICKIQSRLANQKRINRQLNGKLRVYEMKIEAYELEMKRFYEQSEKNQELYQTLLQDLNRQHEILREKDQQLLRSKQTISDIQMSMLKRIGQVEDKLKKSNSQNKQLVQKLRRSNIQLQKQRNLNKQLRKDMTTKIQNMQSSKERYLIEKIQSLKEMVSSSQDEKQYRYLSQISELNQKIYQYQQSIKINNIQIVLMQRKKQQAIKDICDKKDQQIKVQKSMSKTLNQKLTKMQQDLKKIKKNSNTDVCRNRLQTNQIYQEEISLELSPQKF